MQRLLLTSKGFANEAIEEAFLSLLPASPEELRIAIIPTAAKALKGKHPHILAASEHLRNLGFRAIEIVDVEDKERAALLYSYDVLYLGGGNPFYLLSRLRLSGADEIIKKKGSEGTVIMGVSAGAVVLGPDIELVNYFTPQMRTGIQLPDLTALGLFLFPLLPHYAREDVFPGESPIEERIQAFERRHHVSVQRLRDSEALLLRDGDVRHIVEKE